MPTVKYRAAQIPRNTTYCKWAFTWIFINNMTPYTCQVWWDCHIIKIQFFLRASHFGMADHIMLTIFFSYETTKKQFKLLWATRERRAYNVVHTCSSTAVVLVYATLLRSPVADWWSSNPPLPWRHPGVTSSAQSDIARYLRKVRTLEETQRRHHLSECLHFIHCDIAASQSNRPLHDAGLKSHIFGGSKLLLPGARPGSKTNFVVAKLYVNFLRNENILIL